MKKQRILTCGPTMIDFKVAVDPQKAEDQALMDFMKFKSGGKRTIDEDGSGEYYSELFYEGRWLDKQQPGGSVFNTTITMKSVLGDAADLTFLGMQGNRHFAKAIEKALAKAGVQFVSPKLPDGTISACGMSYILDPEGRDGLERSIATWPGNAPEVFTPDRVQGLEQMVKDCDVMMLGGSTWEKVNWDLACELMKLRWDYGKTLILSLPVDKKFADKHKQYFQDLVPSANIVLANDDELKATYGITAEGQEGTWQALVKLREDFSRNQKASLEAFSENHHRPWIGDTRQVGFVTAGEYGAFVVDKDDIIPVPAIKVDGPLYKAGVGDTAFAGFLLGYLNDCDPLESAEIAKHLAHAKITQDSVRLENPQKVIIDELPKIAEKLGLVPQEKVKVDRHAHGIPVGARLE